MVLKVLWSFSCFFGGFGGVCGVGKAERLELSRGGKGRVLRWSWVKIKGVLRFMGFRWFWVEGRSRSF